MNPAADPASMPEATSARYVSRPLSGTTNVPWGVTTTSARRDVPTPGSTTATWMVSGGKNGQTEPSTNAAWATSWAGTSCVTSTMFASGFTPRTAPFMAPT